MSSTAKLLQDLTWGDGSNDESARGFVEASMQQAAREWQRAASRNANREKAAHRLALDFLARNLGLWKNEENHWVLHDSLAQICEAIFLETLAPADITPSLFPPNAHGWITTPFRFIGGEEVGVWVSGAYLTDKGNTRVSALAQTDAFSLMENAIRRIGEEAAQAGGGGVTYIAGELRTSISSISSQRDSDVMRLVNAMLLFYGMLDGAYRSKREGWEDIS